MTHVKKNMHLYFTQKSLFLTWYKCYCAIPYLYDKNIYCKQFESEDSKCKHFTVELFGTTLIEIYF